MDQKEFMQIFSLLLATYPQQKTTPETLNVYRLILGHYSADVLRAAVLQTIAENTSQWMPSPGQINQVAINLGRMASNSISGIEAYGILRKTSRYDLLSPDIQRAVDSIGGWRAWGMSQEGCPATRSRFIQAYETIEKRRCDDVEMLPAVNKAVKSLAAGMMMLGGGNE